MALSRFGGVACVALLSTSVFLEAADFVLVDQGGARAVIVVADTPRLNAQQAAAALQETVARMTGVKLPIRHESDYANEAPPILVGMSKLAAKAGVKVEQHKDAFDHYVLRVDEDHIILVGNDGGRLRGTPYAVYDLLQRLGCGWYGDEPLWHVIPKRNTLSAPPMDLDERPAFVDRQMSSLWRIDQAVLDAWRLGSWHVAHSHAFEQLVPRDLYAKDHPDYFGEKQPCLTHPDVIEIVTRQYRDELDKGEGVVAFSLSVNDALGFCDCDRCRAVGNASALNLHFANAVARNLAKTHPNRYLLTFYAFWGTHDPPYPPLRAEPGVCVMQVNEGNHIQPWDKPERPDIGQIIDRNNTRELIAFESWKRTGAQLGIYEWWIPSCDHEEWRQVPWYSGETTLRNLRFWKRQDVRYVAYQTGVGDETGLPIRWPLFYVGARGMWNPELTAERIMREACEKLYGPAARPMLRFYQVIEKAMADSTLLAKSWRLPSPEKIYTPQVQAQAAAALDKAASVDADTLVHARIAAEQKMWDRAKRLMAKLRVNPQGGRPSKANPGM